MKLHNFLIDREEGGGKGFIDDEEEREALEQAARWYEECKERARLGVRSLVYATGNFENAVSEKREQLREIVRSSGNRRTRLVMAPGL